MTTTSPTPPIDPTDPRWHFGTLKLKADKVNVRSTPEVLATNDIGDLTRADDGKDCDFIPSIVPGWHALRMTTAADGAVNSFVSAEWADITERDLRPAANDFRWRRVTLLEVQASIPVYVQPRVGYTTFALLTPAAVGTVISVIEGVFSGFTAVKVPTGVGFIENTRLWVLGAPPDDTLTEAKVRQIIEETVNAAMLAVVEKITEETRVQLSEALLRLAFLLKDSAASETRAVEKEAA